MIKFPASKTQLIIFLGIFAAYLSIINKDAAFLFGLFIAVISALAADYFFMYLKKEELRLDDSSVISGLIIGFLLLSAQPWWIFSLASISAIASKYLIRVNKKHIFNPAAFGILLAVIFFRGFTQWQGASIWYLILPFGIYFVYKVKKLEIIIVYSLAFLILFGIQGFGYFNYFFVLVMLIEPKTTPVTKRGR